MDAASDSPIQDPIHEQASQALGVLDELAPATHSSSKTSFEANLERWAGRLLFAALVFLAMLAVLAVLRKADRLGPSWNIWALGVAACAELCAVSSMLVQTGAGVWFVLRFRERATAMRHRELLHDIGAAKSLERFSQAALLMLDSWLARYVARLERRQAMFFGSSDKIAVLSISALVVGLGKQFLDAYDQAPKVLPHWSVEMSNWAGLGLQFTLAAITGLAVGCVFLGRVIRRTQYQRDLLALALDSPARRMPMSSKVLRSGVPPSATRS